MLISAPSPSILLLLLFGVRWFVRVEEAGWRRVRVKRTHEVASAGHTSAMARRPAAQELPLSQAFQRFWLGICKLDVGRKAQLFTYGLLHGALQLSCQYCMQTIQGNGRMV